MPRNDSSRRRTALAVALLVAVAVVPFLGSVRGEFIYDDRVQILDNPLIQQPGAPRSGAHERRLRLQRRARSRLEQLLSPGLRPLAGGQLAAVRRATAWLAPDEPGAARGRRPARFRAPAPARFRLANGVLRRGPLRRASGTRRVGRLDFGFAGPPDVGRFSRHPGARSAGARETPRSPAHPRTGTRSPGAAQQGDRPPAAARRRGAGLEPLRRPALGFARARLHAGDAPLCGARRRLPAGASRGHRRLRHGDPMDAPPGRSGAQPAGSRFFLPTAGVASVLDRPDLSAANRHPRYRRLGQLRASAARDARSRRTLLGGEPTLAEPPALRRAGAATARSGAESERLHAGADRPRSLPLSAPARLARHPRIVRIAWIAWIARIGACVRLPRSAEGDDPQPACCRRSPGTRAPSPPRGANDRPGAGLPRRTRPVHGRGPHRSGRRLSLGPARRHRVPPRAVRGGGAGARIGRWR